MDQSNRAAADDGGEHTPPSHPTTVPPSSAPVPRSSSHLRQERSRLCVIVVEDSLVDTQIIKHGLARASEPFEIKSARTGAVAIDLIRAHDPDCVLLDYHLPDQTTEQFIAELRALPGGAPPVVMITADTSQKVGIESMKLGVSDFISKSDFSETDLGALITRVVGERRASQSMEGARISAKLSSLAQLVANTAHEICNPAAVARMALSSVGSTLVSSTNPKHARDLKQLGSLLSAADEALARIGQVIRELEDQTGVATGYFHPLVLDDLVRVAWGGMNAAVVLPLHIENNLSALGNIEGDRSQLIRLVGDVLENAAHAAGPEGTIRVSTFLDAGDAVLLIDDDGPGVPAQLRARVFEPLFSTRGTLGMGLARATAVLDRHHGTIRVLDSPLGGARFEIRLPLLQTKFE